MSLLQKLAYHLTIKPRLNRLKKLLPEARIHPAGSRYVCSPPVMRTDIDFLVYTEKSTETFLTLVEAGYKKSEVASYRGMTDSSEFDAWRKGAVNLIVTSSLHYAETFQTATSICKTYNVREKWHRVIIHETLRGNDLIGDSISDLMPPLRQLILPFRGVHSNAIHKAYRAKHGLVL